MRVSHITSNSSVNFSKGGNSRGNVRTGTVPATSVQKVGAKVAKQESVGFFRSIYNHAKTFIGVITTP